MHDEAHLQVLQELRRAGRPCFSWDEIVGICQSSLRKFPDGLGELTRLRAATSEADGLAEVVVPDHSITDGPFGKAENFKLVGPSAPVARLGDSTSPW
jgi:hypothetical protein